MNIFPTLEEDNEIPTTASLCKVSLENQTLFISPLLEGFDSENFKFAHPELEGKELNAALKAEESLHTILHREAIAETVSICGNCPRIQTCLDEVADFEDSGLRIYGVAGGLEPHQRTKYRRQRAKAQVKRESLEAEQMKEARKKKEALLTSR